MEELRQENMRLRAENQELRVQIHQLKRMAFEDELTQLFNRRFFKLQFERLSLDRVSLIMLDIDYFKKVNDTWGHLKADHILSLVARIIKEKTRSTDIVARWGGEEFVVLLPGASRRTAFNIGQRILQSIRERTPVTVSMGIATAYNKNLKEEIMDRADRALYVSKKNGRDRITAVSVN